MSAVRLISLGFLEGFEMSVFITAVVFTLIVVVIHLCFGRRGKSKSKVEHLVIIGLDFSTSMRDKATASAKGWSLFRREQQSIINTRYALYRVCGTVTPVGDRFWWPGNLPTWTATEFIGLTLRGSALNAFFQEACIAAAQWRNDGNTGSVQILLFTDGAPHVFDRVGKPKNGNAP